MQFVCTGKPGLLLKSALKYFVSVIVKLYHCACLIRRGQDRPWFMAVRSVKACV